MTQRIQAALITPPNGGNCTADEDCLLSNERLSRTEQLCSANFTHSLTNVEENKLSDDEEEDPNEGLGEESSSDGDGTVSYGEQQQPSLESCSVR